MRKTYAFDLDDVLAEFHQTFIDFSKARYGTTARMEDFIHADINKAWGVPHEEVMRRIGEFDAAESKRNIPPRAGAQEMVATLAHYHSLHIITNRPIEVRDDTLWWLDLHFPNKFCDVHFCSRDYGKTLTRSKSSVCKHINAPILLEDNLFNARPCAKDGIHVYLFKRPWNHQELILMADELPLMSGAIIPIRDWQDPILETLRW